MRTEFSKLSTSAEAVWRVGMILVRNLSAAGKYEYIYTRVKLGSVVGNRDTQKGGVLGSSQSDKGKQRRTRASQLIVANRKGHCHLASLTISHLPARYIRVE